MFGKSISNMQELFRDQLIRVQIRHIPLSRRDKDGKVRGSEVLNLVRRK